MSKLEPVITDKALDVEGTSLEQWNKGKLIDIHIPSSDRHWAANLFRFTDDEGEDHSILFVESVPPEDL